MTSPFTRLLRLAGLLVVCLVASGSLNTAFGSGGDCSSTSAVWAPGELVVDAPVGLGTVSLAMAGDCSTNLGECYASCQAMEPTPVEACFTYCEVEFDWCLGWANSAYSVNALL
jgi:hypothetical protein